MSGDPILDLIAARFGDGILASHAHAGDRTVLIRPGIVRDVLEFARREPGIATDFLADLSAVDTKDLAPSLRAGPVLAAPDRFQVVYHLRGAENARRLRVKASVSGDDPAIDSIHDLWKCANWFEREVYDMFGVRFRGHPNLKRILCHKDFQGHALRKDYDVRKGQWLEESDDLLDELGGFGANPDDGGFTELLPVNIGPSHPATHGTLRILAKLDGETIVKAASEIGFLHRAFEKHCETGTWSMVVPYTDRLNYCSAMLNNVAWVRAVEKLCGIEVPERAGLIRIIIAELSRIIDHLVCSGANLIDLGAMTNFWWLFAMREKIYGALEGLCGARLTSSYCRIGGVAQDLQPGFEDSVREALRELPGAVADVLALVQRNRIFLDRTVGVGVIPKAEALSYGYTGPCLRASGVSYDLRKTEPWGAYADLSFEVPVRSNGDTFDRFMIRFDEIVQSMRIIEQALDRLRPGPILTDDPRFALPAKQDVYNTIEALMNHFVLIYDGIRVPEGEAYLATEGANGELGFYIVADGTGRPYRVRCRPPCFPIYSSFPRLIEGGLIADAVAVLGSLNIIVGELDR